MDMTLSEAAELIGIPQKRLYRAVKAGKLKADQRHQGSRWEYLVTRHDLEEFQRSTDRLVDQDGRPTATDSATGRPTQGPVARPADQPPVELYLALVDRLQRAERRTVELELTLRQSQRLLAENAESITEKEAQTMEACARLQALENAKQLEIEKLAFELEATHRQREQELASENTRLFTDLEATRRQLEEAQRPSGLLSWLGLRKKRSAPASVDKAV